MTGKYLIMILGVAGPLRLLATLYLFLSDDWSTYMFYAGLMLMFFVSVWQWLIPLCTSFVNNRGGKVS